MRSNHLIEAGLLKLFHLFLIFSFVFSLSFSISPPSVVKADSTITVTTSNDAINTDGYCSLREAIISANKDKATSSNFGECLAGTQSDTIVLNEGSYLLTRTDSGNENSSSTGDLDISGNLIIQGAGADKTIIDGTMLTDRIFQVLSGSVILKDLTLLGGNSNRDGGSIYNEGVLRIENSAIKAAYAAGDGGSIYNGKTGQLNIINSLIFESSAANNGGGIFNNGGLLSITNSTISGNLAGGSGGAIWNKGTLNLLNDTISQNVADNNSDGIGDGGGIFLSASNAISKNTILAGNQDKGSGFFAPECMGTISSSGHNLIEDLNGCSLGNIKQSDILEIDPLLLPIANNGGPTFTHALAADSPAVDAGDNLNCPVTDQRGFPRPVGTSCDIGAFEDQDPLQHNPFIVNTISDFNDGKCSFLDCSLREAIIAANEMNNGNEPDSIKFALPGDAPYTLQINSSLPLVSDPLIIDGRTQQGFIEMPVVVLDGSNAGSGTSGLTIATTGSLIQGLTISGFSGSGIKVISGDGNTFSNNRIFGNGLLGIDLSGDGVTLNDFSDIDQGPNNLINFPVLNRVIPAPNHTVFEGRFNGAAEQSYQISLYSNDNCDISGYGEGQDFLDSFSLTTNEQGNALFSYESDQTIQANRFISATATGVDGSTSEFSACIISGNGNDSWTNAMNLSPDPISGLPAFVSQYLDIKGQSRWYKFHVQPESRVTVTLTDLPANYDLTLYKDIASAFKTISNPQDLVRLGAEFAPDAFSPDAFSPDAFSPDAFSPDAFSPDAFSPDAFSPDAFSPDAFSPDAFSPDAFSPDAFSPDAFSPDAFSPDAFSPDAFSPDAFSPDAFSPDAFSGAQSRSLLAVSAFEGTSSEGIQVNTWTQSGDFYVRVRGRNGNFSLSAPYQLNVNLTGSTCNNVMPITVQRTLQANAGNFQTVILINPDRMSGSPDEKTALLDQLEALASRPEVAGVVVNVSQDARVAAAYQLADNNPQCPAAQNILAGTIKELVDLYRTDNPLQYVVLVGSDQVIPFFRHADNALLGNEKNYVPPVLENTPSQASLKSGYFLSQDDYGSDFSLSIKNDNLPVVDLAVGRLVESPSDVITVLNGYLSTSAGVLPSPESILVTGYDFLTDAAQAVQSQLENSSGLTADTLIQERDQSPTSSSAWTADQLRNALLGSRHDLIFLAGHFSSSSALAADYSTRLTTGDLISSPVNLVNSIIYSAGCHAGYNLVDDHAVPNITPQPDWASAFAQKGATLIAGTGYQYGDTDFIEYSERLYLEFTRQLGSGNSPVPVGIALMHAKQKYLADTAVMRPIHQKALMEAALFGLPMLSVNLPGERFDAITDSPIVSQAELISTNPGLTFGLATADVSLQTSLMSNSVLLDSVSNSDAQSATYLSGSSGVITNPAEPVFPLEKWNVSLPDTVLRGVGFLGGNYSDGGEISPLTGASTTEIRGIHPPFFSNVFFPVQPWSINYFDELSNNNPGATMLQVIPAQYISDPASLNKGSFRQFDQMDFRLFYNNNTDTFQGNSTPALASAPSIVNVDAQAISDQVTFSATVVANPSVGVQSVWITYTATNGPLYGEWQSINLAQDPLDSTHWFGSLPITATAPEDIRYIVQAVNGVGLVSLSTNIGRYFIPNVGDSTTLPTELVLQSPESGVYGTLSNYHALLVSNSLPLAGLPVIMRVGNQTRVGITDTDGIVSINIPLLTFPGTNKVYASFPGNSDYTASSISGSIEIAKAATQLSLNQNASVIRPGENGGISVSLKAGNRPLSDKTVFFRFNNGSGDLTYPSFTNFLGIANFNSSNLPPGNYQVTVYFNGQIPFNNQFISIEDERFLPSSATGELRIDAYPLASDDSYSLEEDTALIIAAPGVLVNDNDPEGDMLSVTLSQGTQHGELNLLRDGSFTYIPDPDFFGTDRFTYTLSDTFGSSTIEAAVYLSINPVNDAPVSENDEYTVDQRSSLSIDSPGLLGNDYDVDNNNLEALLKEGPLHGNLFFNNDGSFTYEPDLTFFGVDTFTYQANDGDLLSNIATVTILVKQVNQPPICTNPISSSIIIWPPNGDFFQVQVLNVTDPDHDNVSIRIDSIFQDEPVGKQVDGDGIGTDIALVRSERDGNGNGRVYHIFFTAWDDFGGVCSGELLVPVVDHDLGSGIGAIDDGPLYDSTIPTN